MAHVIAVRWTVQPGREQEVLDLARTMVEPSNAEPGCRLYALHVDPDDARRLFLYEVYDDAAAFDAHCASEHFRATVEARIFPLLEERRLEVYASA